MKTATTASLLTALLATGASATPGLFGELHSDWDAAKTSAEDAWSSIKATESSKTATHTSSSSPSSSSSSATATTTAYPGCTSSASKSWCGVTIEGQTGEDLFDDAIGDNDDDNDDDDSNNDKDDNDDDDDDDDDDDVDVDDDDDDDSSSSKSSKSKSNDKRKNTTTTTTKKDKQQQPTTYNVTITNSKCRQVASQTNVKADRTVSFNSSVGEWEFGVYTGTGLDMTYEGRNISDFRKWDTWGVQYLNYTEGRLLMYGGIENCTSADDEKDKDGKGDDDDDEDDDKDGAAVRASASGWALVAALAAMTAVL